MFPEPSPALASPDDGQRHHARRLELWRAYSAVFGSPEGQRVLADLEAYCHAFARLDARAQDGSIDPLSLAVLEGRRQVWLHILARCREPAPPRSQEEGS